ncbi:transcobalamin-1-like [Nelusetta ayraudi]|uniref:transcobalamin-1-like n=1 Tax=Nelusetta ayraudi TaxID=303726 RepID=UPI003F6EAA28
MELMPSLLSAALLLLLSPGTLTGVPKMDAVSVPIGVEVRNLLHNSRPLTLSTGTVYRGILLGALKRLMSTNANFAFTYTEDRNYGPSLDSVNGLAGNDYDRTYWELLVETPDGNITRPDVGIGCYIPNANENIILNFTTW